MVSPNCCSCHSCCKRTPWTTGSQWVTPGPIAAVCHVAKILYVMGTKEILCFLVHCYDLFRFPFNPVYQEKVSHRMGSVMHFTDKELLFYPHIYTCDLQQNVFHEKSQCVLLDQQICRTPFWNGTPCLYLCIQSKLSQLCQRQHTRKRRPGGSRCSNKSKAQMEWTIIAFPFYICLWQVHGWNLCLYGGLPEKRHGQHICKYDYVHSMLLWRP